jgi:hypothetical protein
MTKDEGRMSKEGQMSNVESTFGHSSFVLRPSFDIRHSTFDIRPSSLVRPILPEPAERRQGA